MVAQRPRRGSVDHRRCRGRSVGWARRCMRRWRGGGRRARGRLGGARRRRGGGGCRCWVGGGPVWLLLLLLILVGCGCGRGLERVHGWVGVRNDDDDDDVVQAEVLDGCGESGGSRGWIPWVPRR